MRQRMVFKHQMPDFAVDAAVRLAVVLEEVNERLGVRRIADALSEQFPLTDDGVVFGGDMLQQLQGLRRFVCVFAGQCVGLFIGDYGVNKQNINRLAAQWRGWRETGGCLCRRCAELEQ